MSATATPKADTGPSNAPKLSLNKQIVLEEDEYTEGLSRIIARDFFPTLHHLTAANDYLTALESRDPSLIDASVRTLRDLGPTPIVSRPGETPIDPRRNTSQSGPNKRRKRIEDEMGLDEYQAWFTSEDNASFTEILEDENRKRRDRFKWAWEAQRKAMDGKMIEDTNRQRMLLEGTGESDARGVGVRPGVRGRIAIEKPEVLLITQGEAAKSKDERKEEQEAMEEDDADESQHQQDGSDENVMAPVKDSRPINVSTWNFKTRNNLMFLPDADQSPYHTESSSSLTILSTSSSTTLTEGIRQPKSITHSATRLPSPPPESSTSNSSAQVPASPSRSRINAAIAGVRYISSSGGDDQGGEAEGPNGYNYVPSLPSVSPDQLGPLALKELMTMGTLLSTPRLLSSTRDAGGEFDHPDSTPFRIAPPSRREQTGLRLSMNASRAIREKAAKLNGSSQTPRTVVTTREKGKGEMAPPSATPKRTANDLTPAARALLARSTTKSTAGMTPVHHTSSSGSIFSARPGTGSTYERDLRKVKWTPSPMTRR